MIEMLRRMLFLLLLACCLAILAGMCGMPFMQDFSFAHNSDASGFGSSLHLVFNDFHPWRPDSALLFLDLLFLPSQAFLTGSYFAAVFFVFISGCYFLFRTRERDLHAATLCLLFPLLYICIVGIDVVAFAALAWLPWLLWASFRLRVDHSSWIWWAVVFGFFSWRLGASAHALSFLGAGWVLVCTLGFHGKNSETFPTRGFGLFLLLTLLLLPALWSTFHLPEAAMPDYPASARVVPDDGVPGHVHPLLGSGPKVPIIDRASLRGFFAPWCASFLLLAVLNILQALRRNAGCTALTAAVISCCGFFVLCWDVYLPETLALIGPLAAMQRLIPGLLFLSPHAFIFGLSLLGMLLLQAQSPRSWLTPVLCSFCVLTTRLLIPFPCPQSVATEIPASDPGRAIALSPSAAVLKKAGTWILKDRRVASWQSLSDAAPDVVITSWPEARPKQIKHLFDQRTRSRWSLFRGKQNADEKLCLNFSRPLSLSGIELSTGDFVADFPRGLRISTVSNCEAPDKAVTSTIVDYPRWEGPVQFTVRGYPYFGGQSNVRVIFPKTVEATAILVEQTGVSSNFDWSVAEIFLRLDNDSSTDVYD